MITKYLSIKQPFASQIFAKKFRKDIENRSWKTDFRGRMYIHAGKNKSEIKVMEQAFKEDGIPFPKNMEFGKIIGSVELLDCIKGTELPEDAMWANSDSFCFILQKPKLLKTPIDFKANIGIRTLPNDILEKLKEI